MKLQISNCKKAAVQDGMIGLFFEDINYAADGGLYAEMIENRSFSFVDCYGDVGDYYTKPAWQPDQPRESVVSAVHGAGCRTGLLE